MQRLYLLLTLISFSILYCQNTETDDEYKKLIDSAITLKLQSSNINKYYVLNSDNQPYLLSDRMKLEGLETINIYDKKNKKILAKGIEVWKIVSRLNKNQLEIRIIDFSVRLQKDNYQFNNSGGSTFIYEYSCKMGNWELVSEKHSGI